MSVLVRHFKLKTGIISYTGSVFKAVWRSPPSEPEFLLQGNGKQQMFLGRTLTEWLQECFAALSNRSCCYLTSADQHSQIKS